VVVITQQGIAEGLGLSLKTVQRAFNQPESVSAVQRERILSYAAKHGYVPNRSARALQGGTQARLGLITLRTPAPFWDEVGAGADLAAHQIAHLGYDVVYKRVSNQASLMRALRELHNSGVDCLGLVNHTFLDMQRVLDWVEKHQVPFAAFNIDFLDTGRLCYLGPDYRQQGQLAGEVITNLMREPGTVALLTAEFDDGTFLPGADIHRQRRDNIVTILERREDLRVVEIPIILHGQTVDGSDVKAAIAKLRGTRKLVYCIPPFPSYLVDRIERTGGRNGLEFMGFDLSPRISGLLQSGAITAEIYQNPKLQGYGIVKLMETFMETGRRPPKDRYIVTPQVIFNSNVDQRSNFDIISEISEPLLTPQISYEFGPAESRDP
jgi:DNA-binding LacI/PurR family transcriptional regulator